MGSIKGDDNICIVTLVDENRRLQLTFVTDADMRRQLSLRINTANVEGCCSKLLPEVMWESLRGFSVAEDYEMMIYSVGDDGEYRTVLANKIFGGNYEIRLADAVLLQMLSDIPLYLKGELVSRQMAPFREGANSTAVPINIMPMEVLERGLEDCLEKEDYKMAQRLNDEINKRKSFNNIRRTNP